MIIVSFYLILFFSLMAHLVLRSPLGTWDYGFNVFSKLVIDRNQYHLFCWAFGLVLIKLVERNDERNSTFR